MITMRLEALGKGIAFDTDNAYAICLMCTKDASVC